MPPTSYRALTALVSVAALIIYVVGCSKPADSGSGKLDRPNTASSDTANDSSPDNSKLFADWPVPLAALLISGEQDGYLEPCGCTSGQLGGLRRRYDLIRRIRDQNWPLALIDLGSLVKDPAGARGGFEQAKIKFTVALKALALLKYDALALGAEDLKIGVDEALAQFLNMGEKPKIVVANVTAPGFESTIQPSLRTTAGPIKIGITSVIDPAAVEALMDPAKDLLSVKAPADSLPAVLADLEKDTRVQVLLVQGPPELAKTLAGKHPGFDIVVSTSEVVVPPEEAEMLNDGKTMLISVGKKGQYVGVVGLFQDPNQKFRYRRQTLNNRFNGPAEPMHVLLDEEFQNMLKVVGVVENFPRRDSANGAPGSKFAGAESCKTCHPNTYAKWATTKHANAYQDLLEAPNGSRQHDAECISCHTTGFEFHSGWRSAEQTPYLKGNQCENCHGPASKHVAEPDNLDFRKAIARTAGDANRNRLCLQCHDEDNSPKFDFATYWGKVAHSKLDTYDDPKVHQGVPVKVARRLPK